MKQTYNSSGYDFATKFVGGQNEKAVDFRNNILNTKNTEELYDIKGKKYYISKNMSLSDIPTDLQKGDAVLFERGGLWRLGNNPPIVVPEGVIFGSYGEGDKPKFYGSTRNYADNSIWEKRDGNINFIHLGGGNVGIIVFNDEAALGVKKWTLDEVTQNYDFYFDPENGDLYFYYDGDLEADFDSIEIGQRGDILEVHSFAVADNLCVRYTGSHGIAIPGGSHDFAVTNCEVGILGGSQQFKQVRFGNGIEMQLGVKNAIIKNNWVYQCYDAGITFQSWSSAKMDTFYEDIDISDNLIEYNYYGLEFFTTMEEVSGLRSTLINISVKNNFFRFSGYVWSYEQRPDHWMNAHIRCGQDNFFRETENFTFEDNIFDCSRANIVFWWWHSIEHSVSRPYPHPGVSAKNNSYYQAPMPDKRCMTFHDSIPALAEDVVALERGVKIFDSAPKEIVWVEKLGN